MSRRRARSQGRPGRVLRFVQQLPRNPADLDPLQQDDRPDAAFERRWHGDLKRRIIVVLSILTFWVVVVEARLVDLQVFRHDQMTRWALDQQLNTLHLVGIRGDITDRNGEVLAYSVPADSIAATPRNIKDPVKTVESMCGALGDCTAADRAEFLAAFSTNNVWTLVRRPGSVSPGQAERLAKLKIPGIALSRDTQRYYPNGTLASQVVGFVGRDNNGLGGIEHAYDPAIKGEAGTVRVEQDARERPMEMSVEQAPTSGATVELTLDASLQYIAERELAAGVAAHHADGGSAVIMSPNTGEILAVANVPTFDPNTYGRVPAEALRDRAVQDVYEPGSTFKIVTVSAALQEGIWSPTDLIDTAPGYLQIGARRIHDSEGHNNGVLSVTDVVVKSSNVGAGKIGLKIGPDVLERYAQRYGFGQALLPSRLGQSAGRVYSVAELNPSALASMSIGYQISVTPVQMAACVSAVANGGTLYEPHLVRAFIRDEGREDHAPKALRQVISPAVAATMTSILEQVVVRGTGTKAAVSGFTVAGKTGTAAKLVNHAYSTTAYNASFVGFVPSRHPVLTIVVVVDNPHGGSYFGGDVAAPIFSRIADAALRQLRVTPTSPLPSPVIVAPPAPRPVPAPAPIVLQAADAAGPRMPDVRGLTAREAIRALDAAGLGVRLTGSGIVTSQMPNAGEPIAAGDVSTLQLGRLEPAAHDGRAAGKASR